MADEAILFTDAVAERTALVRLDGFLSQKILCLGGEWVSRGAVIKYVANVASGVHSTVPEDPEHLLIARIRNCVTQKKSGKNVQTTISGRNF